MAFKLADLGTQFVLLVGLMENGLPVELVRCLVSLIALNALATAVMVGSRVRFELLLDAMYVLSISLTHSVHSRFTLCVYLAVLSLDALVAIAFPMLVAVYCMNSFAIDRRLISINLEVFPLGFFEREASAMTDPVQPEIIRNAVGSLRITSVLTFFARIGTNLALCRRFYQLEDRITHAHKRKRAVYPSSLLAAAGFVVIAAAAFVFAELSIHTSTAACQPHPVCVQHAWRWVTHHDGDLEQCPCLTIVDIDTRLKTYKEWVHPPDVTEKVAQLSASGYLQTIKLVNRQLPAIPESIRQCKHLKRMYVCWMDTHGM